jgi:hypothetical protein
MRSPFFTATIGRHRAAAPFRVNDDAAVHLLVLDVDPLAVKPELRAEVGRAVEAVGERAVEVRGHSDAIGGVGRNRAVRVDLVQDAFELLRGVGPHLDAREAGTVLALAEPQRLDVVAPAARKNGVEHFGEQQRVDNVPGHLDVFDMRCRHANLRNGSPVIDTGRTWRLRAPERRFAGSAVDAGAPRR